MTFVRAWVNHSTIRTETLKAYLFTITRNIYLEQQRKRKRQVAFEDIHPDPALGPDRLTKAQGELQRTQQLLQTLPEIDRVAFCAFSTSCPMSRLPVFWDSPWRRPKSRCTALGSSCSKLVLARMSHQDGNHTTDHSRFAAHPFGERSERRAQATSHRCSSGKRLSSLASAPCAASW